MTGGGARAAYQVGVLRAISELLPSNAPSPFSIICGTSAGALNAAALAANAMNFRKAVRPLMTVWKNFRVNQVYRSDPVGALSNSARWIASPLLSQLARQRAVSLLDNSPLAELLRRNLPFENIQKCIDAGALYALSITASGYASGQSVTFFQGVAEIEPWKRVRRIGFAAQIGVEHLLASSAIPFFFPAVKINREYFGDGSMRQIAPVSPALHLGADRVLVIGVRRQAEPDRIQVTEYPPLAQIAGHTLNSIFLDSMDADLERLQRINRTITLIPPAAMEQNQLQLRQVDVLVVYPSEDIAQIASRHADTLPTTIRLLFRLIGANKKSGANLLSYLLFEKPFTRALISLGYQDTMRRKEEILDFIGIKAGVE